MKNIKSILTVLTAGAAMLAACTSAHAGGEYTVSVTMPPEANEMMAYLVDFDSGDKIDSVVVDNNEALFKGNIDKPVMARLAMNGSRMGTFVLEPGVITFHLDSRQATGSPLNVRLNMLADTLSAIENEFRALPRDSAFESRATALSESYNKVVDRAVSDNTDNPIGLYFFLQQAYELENSQALAEALTAYPAFGLSKRVRALQESFAAKEETSPGHRFKDFAIQYEGTDSVARLSDYAGRGKWLLVDFWASWCGPCIRETKVLKEILAEYGPLGLDVLGVAVWDEPENTLAAIQQHQLPWPQIIGAQTVPTDLYGISGIPCIILIDPEGNIVARDLQDDALRKAVRDAIVPAAEASAAPKR